MFVVLLAALLGIVFMKHRVASAKVVTTTVAQNTPPPTPSMPQPITIEPPPSDEISVTATAPTPTHTLVKPPTAEKSSNENKIATPAGQSRPKDPPLDPGARAALSLVGADSDAEDYWVGAINDPTLPAEERKDLIEDLNEDGLSNPDNPGMNDLPLIVSRLQLIEELMPFAMDKVNHDAFREAYKDLSKMYADLNH